MEHALGVRAWGLDSTRPIHVRLIQLSSVELHAICSGVGFVLVLQGMQQTYAAELSRQSPWGRACGGQKGTADSGQRAVALIA